MEDHFPETKENVVDYKKISNPGPIPKHFLGFSYIRSEDYELDYSFDYAELNNHSDNTFNNKVKINHKTGVVIEE